MDKSTLLIPEITVETKNWTAVITITEELATLNCRNGEKLKRYIFSDSEGNEIAATVYGRDVLTIGQVLEHLKVYEITNARVQDVEPVYRILNNPIQWRLQQDTLIRPMPHVNPNLRYFLDSVTPFGLINESMKDSNTTVDVMGIIIDAEAKQSIPGKNDVQRFTLVNSEGRPMSVSIWDPVLTYYKTALDEAIQKTSVVVAKRLRVTTFEGISLSSKNSSSFTFNPPLEEAGNLKSWFFSLNKPDVQQLQDVKSANVSRDLVNRGAMTVHLLNEVINATEPGDYWVRGLIQIPEEDQKLFYIGCSNCHTKISAADGVNYHCWVCNKDAIATVRAIVALCITDQTNTIKVVAVGEIAEKILQSSTDRVAKISTLGQPYDLASINSEFKDRIFLILLRRPYGKRPGDQRRLLMITYFDESNLSSGSQSSTHEPSSPSNFASPECMDNKKQANYSVSPLKRQMSEITIDNDMKMKKQLLMSLNEETSHHIEEDSNDVWL